MLHYKDLKDKKNSYLLYTVMFVVSVAVLGFLIQMVIYGLGTMAKEGKFQYNFMLIFELETWITGLVAIGVIILVYVITHTDKIGKGSFLEGNGKDGDVVSVLENSRFMTDKERDFNFQAFNYDAANGVKNDGVPMRAVLDNKGKLQCNFMSGAHFLVNGDTGSGKTTTFINPMI